MSSLRTAADVLEEYNAVRAAYLKAVGKASYSISSGAGSRSLANQEVDKLRTEMQNLSSEYDRLSSGRKGLKIKGVTPV